MLGELEQVQLECQLGQSDSLQQCASIQIFPNQDLLEKKKTQFSKYDEVVSSDAKCQMRSLNYDPTLNQYPVVSAAFIPYVYLPTLPVVTGGNKFRNKR